MKATLTGANYGAGTITIDLGVWEKINGNGKATPEQIKAALEAVKGVTAVTIDGSKATITYNGSELEGTIPSTPVKLFKVSYPGGEDYLGTGFVDITGVTTGVKYLIDATIDGGTSVAVNDGKATLPVPTKEMTYDEAFKVANGTTITNGEIKDSNNAVVLVAGIKTATGTMPLATAKHAYLRKGAVLKLTKGAGVSAPEASATLTIGGVDTVINFNADGTMDPNTVSINAGGANKEVSITVTAPTAPQKTYSVSMNGGTPVEMTGYDTHVFEGIPAGAKIVCEKDGEIVAINAGDVAASTYGEYNYTLATADASATGSTEIKLFTAWEIDCASQTDFKLYETNPVGAADAPAAMSGTKLVKTTGSTTLYMVANNGNDYMVPKDSLKNTVMNVVRKPSQKTTDGKGVWSFVVAENIADSFESAVKVGTEVKFAPGAMTNATGVQSDTLLTIAVGHASDVEVALTWTPESDTFKGKMEVTNNGKIKFTPETDVAAGDASDGTEMGTLTVKVSVKSGSETVVMSSTFTVNAAS